MKKTGFRRITGFLTGLTVILSLNSCEKTEYDLIDPETTGKWTLYSTSTGLPANSIRDITRDSQENLWVTFSASGAAMYKNGAWTTFTTTNSAILSNSVTALENGPNGIVYVGTSNGLAIRNATGTWSSYKDPLVTTMPVNTVKVASNGWIWVGTEGRGFYVNDGSGYDQFYSASFANVNTIEEDSKKNIFLGTDNGLLKWDGTAWSILTITNGLPDNEVTSLYLDSQNKLWIGTSGGLTVAYLDNVGLHNISLMNGTSGTFVRDIYEDRRGDIWFATWFDGLIRYDGVIPTSYKKYSGFFEDDVNCIGEDKDGNMWFGLYSKGLVKYTLPIR